MEIKTDNPNFKKLLLQILSELKTKVDIYDGQSEYLHLGKAVKSILEKCRDTLELLAVQKSSVYDNPSKFERLREVALTDLKLQGLHKNDDRLTELSLSEKVLGGIFAGAGFLPESLRPGLTPKEKTISRIASTLALSVGAIGWDGFVEGFYVKKEKKIPLILSKKKAVDEPLKRKKTVVGRKLELGLFDSFVKSEQRILNYYGPGGIGKTVIGNKIKESFQSSDFDFSFTDGYNKSLTPALILDSITQSLSIGENIPNAFNNFNREFTDYMAIQQFFGMTDGLDSVYDNFGKLNTELFREKLTGMPRKMVETVLNKVSLMRYLRNAERNLTSTWLDDISTITEQHEYRPFLLFDTFEEIEDFSDWFNQDFYPELPESVRLCILGRNSLRKVSFDWQEFSDEISEHEIGELSENEAKLLLKINGLYGTQELDSVYSFTGGYPLALALVCHLAEDAGGWHKLNGLEYPRDRYEVAKFLLERLLREQKVGEVREFIEKGVVAPYFNPEIIQLVMSCGIDDARVIYDRIARFSFVERHPMGLKFHDKIREILSARLTTGESKELSEKMRDYLVQQKNVNINF